MVLISISTTVSMYAGMEDSLKKNYPNEINISGSFTDYEISEKIDDEIEKINSSYGVQPKDYGAIHFSTLFASSDGSGKYTVSVNDTSSYTYSSATIIVVMELSEFNELSGTDFTLNPGEVLWYSNDKTLAGQNKVEIISDEKTFAYNTRQLSDINSKLLSEQVYNVVKTAIAIVKDKDELESLQKISDMDMSYSVWYDTNLSEDKSMELAEELDGIDIEGVFVTADNRYNVKNELKQMYGSFLFIGMFVGILFSMATALIIYYKQISEGFEDMERFRIMQNVGMSLSEVKKTIRSQVLTVFFLPLAVAAVHVAVSFRIMKMILNILSLGNNSLFIYCTLATLLVFCVIYGIVFKITAKAYYNIVRV
jgi:putative ABC transport system permease protein